MAPLHRFIPRLAFDARIGALVLLLALSVFAPTAIALPACSADIADATKTTCTYAVPGEGRFVVPTGVTFVNVVARGGSGGRAYAAAGSGALVTTRNLPVVAGVTLVYFVGGGGGKTGTAGAGGGSTSLEASTPNQIIAGGGGGSAMFSAGGNAGLTNGSGEAAPSGGLGGSNGIGGLGTAIVGNGNGGDGNGGPGGASNWAAGGVGNTGSGRGGTTSSTEGGAGGGGFGGGGAGYKNAGTQRGGGGGGSVGPTNASTATTTTYASAGNAPATDSTVGNAGNLTITYTHQVQVLSFLTEVPANATVGDGSYTPRATSSGGLSTTLSVVAEADSVCTIRDGIVSFIKTGTCTIAANQSGSVDYLTAEQITQSFSVAAPPATTASDIQTPLTIKTSARVHDKSFSATVFATSTGTVALQPRTMRDKRPTVRCPNVLQVRSAGEHAVKCTLTSIGLQRLHRGRLTVWVTASFTPVSGASVATRHTLLLS